MDPTGLVTARSIMRKSIIKPLLILAFVAFVALGIKDATSNRHKIEIKNLEIKSKTTELREAQLKSDNLNERIKDADVKNQAEIERLEQERLELDNQNKELQDQLSVKKEAARAESEKLANATPKISAPVSAGGDIQQMIVTAANKYGVSSDRLLRIAKCESGFNPSAKNKGYYAGGGNPTGLFQYLPETWTRYQRKMGVSGWDIYNPQHQAELTAFAFSIGGSGEWECR